MLENTNSHLDRLMTTGVLPPRSRSIKAQPARSSAPPASTAIFVATTPTPPTSSCHWKFPTHDRRRPRSRGGPDSGDRRQHRHDAARAALLTDGSISSSAAAAGSEGLGWAESPRGSLFYAVHFDDDGGLARVKIKSPSFSNWRVFPFTVHDTNMMDYAINEASFGLTVAGCDR